MAGYEHGENEGMMWQREVRENYFMGEVRYVVEYGLWLHNGRRKKDVREDERE